MPEVSVHIDEVSAFQGAELERFHCTVELNVSIAGGVIEFDYGFTTNSVLWMLVSIRLTLPPYLL